MSFQSHHDGDALATPAEYWIDHAAGRLFVRVWAGADPAALPIVMLHDSLGAVALWRDFPAALCAATGRGIIAYDRLGYGRSDPAPGPQPLDFIAAEADGAFARVCAALGIERFVVLGHSVGGGMAVHVAARQPARCAALVTMAAQAFVEDRTRAGILEAQAVFADPQQVERLARYHGDKARWVLGAWIDTWLSPAFDTWSLDAVLGGVACPALIMHGDEDEYGSVAHPRRIAEGIGAHARLEVMDDTRHMPHRERPDVVIDRIAAFLREVE